MSRIHSIDAIRGLCLLIIFVDHNDLGMLSKLTFSNVTFFDAADVFVFMAGLSTYFAYVGRGPYRFGRAMGAAARAVRLYGVNALLMLASFMLLWAAATLVPPADPSTLPHIVLARAGFENFLWQVGTMQQSVGYSTILRLYIYMLLLAPLWLWLASRRYWYPVVPALILWAMAGNFGWVAKDSLTGIPFRLTLIPWTLVFVLGVATGAAIKQGVVLERSRLIGACALGFVLLLPIALNILAGFQPGVGAWLDHRDEHFWLGASKTLQSPLRLLSLLGLVYLFVTHRDAPLFRIFHRIDPENVLCRLGRRSLYVFVVGSLLAILNEWSLWAVLSMELTVWRSGMAVAWELLCAAAGMWILVRVADWRGSGALEVPRKYLSRMLASRSRPCQSVANGNVIASGLGAGYEPDRPSAGAA